MTVTDPIADMLTRMRNAMMVRHDSVMMPSSKMKLAIAKILKDEGFISDYEIVRGKTHRTLRIRLKYRDRGAPIVNGLERVSKPGLRVYVQRNEIPRVFSGLGIAVVSTPKGVLEGHQAWRQGVGGELLCYVW